MALRFWHQLKGRLAKKQAERLQALRREAELATQEDRLEDAAALYGKVIESAIYKAEAFYKRANALNRLGQSERALADYDQALAIDPTYVFAYCNRGVVLERLGRWNDALGSYDRALALDQRDYLTFYNRGSALKALERFGDALSSYERAIELNEKYAPAYVNRGNVLQELRRYEAALASYDQAIQLDTSIAEAYLGRGVSCISLRRIQEALTSYDCAIRLRPDYVDAHSNRGGALQEIGDHENALESYASALKWNPGFAAAWQGQAFSFLQLGRRADAIKSYNEAMTIEPDREFLRGMRLHARMQVCDWSDFSKELQELIAGLQARRPVSAPLPVLALVDSPSLHRTVAEIWADEFLSNESTSAPPSRQDRDKIHVGYFSSDFCEHAVSVATAQLFEMHDRDRFEITAFAFGPKRSDVMLNRLQKAFDRFLQVSEKSDLEIAQLSRNLEIDLAIDLGGYTAHSRTGIFALRAAPIQINYLGYPGTMGTRYMDYIIADSALVPEESKQYFSEKIVYLPATYMPVDSSRPTAATKFEREELGLPRTGFVFCCFNNSYKILPGVFASWMRILKRVNGSVLWLRQDDPVTARNLRREAVLQGVAHERLIFANRTPSFADYLASLRAADIFLDTLPYNAHATAVDALWAGLPVLTRRGESFTGRVAASLLNAIGLPELITSTMDGYENLAVHLAVQHDVLSGIRAKLRDARSSAALFNTRSYTTHLESAYVAVLKRYDAGLAPDHVHITT